MWRSFKVGTLGGMEKCHVFFFAWPKWDLRSMHSKWVNQGKSMIILKEGGFGAEFGFQNLAFFLSAGVEYP